METTISKDIGIRGEFFLPEDVQFTRVEDLSDRAKELLHIEDPNDVAITRTYTRGSTKIIDPDLAELLQEFSDGSTIPYAVARYCQKTKDDPEELLEEALPVLMEMISNSILTPDAGESSSTEFNYEVGQSIDEYEIIDKIQVFHESEVYRVRDMLGCEYVLKSSRISNATNYSIENEKAALLQLDNNNSPDYKSRSGVLNEKHWVLSKWYPGISIGQLSLVYRKTEARNELLKLVGNLLLAYQQLHKRGVLHGDVHPGNLIVGRDDKVNIIDFGNARVINNSKDQVSSRGGVAYFYEPEYACAVLNGEQIPHVTKKSEQFSLGSLIYHLVTGKYYDDFNLEKVEMHQRIAKPEPKPFEYYGLASWPELEKVLRKALSKNPEDRYDDLKQMIDDLPTSVADKDLDQSLKTFVINLSSKLSVEEKYFLNGLHTGPTCSLNGGSAGVAYGFLRLAYTCSNPDWLAQSELWLNKAYNERHKADAYSNIKYLDSYEKVGQLSIHHTQCGLSFISCLISFVKNENHLTKKHLDQFYSDISGECQNDDTTLGKLSVVLAILELNQHLGTTYRSYKDQFNTMGEKLISEVWSSDAIAVEVGQDFSVYNYGFAHGWTGVLYTTLLWSKMTGQELPRSFVEKCEQLEGKIITKGRGSSILWMSPEGQTSGSVSSWCNGSSGMIYLFALLYETYGDLKYQRIVEDIAWDIWDSQSSTIDLCCGSAGRIFALLRAAQVLESEEWKSRAEQLACLSIELAAKLDSEEHPAYSLFKGQLGFALSCQAILKPDLVNMPMMGLL